MDESKTSPTKCFKKLSDLYNVENFSEELSLRYQDSDTDILKALAVKDVAYARGENPSISLICN